MAFDLGDVANLGITVKDSSNALTSGGTVVAAVTAPDGTSSTPTVTNPSLGSYTIAYTTAQVGRHSIRWTVTLPTANAHTDVFDVLDPNLLPIVSLTDLKAHLKDASTSTANDDQYRYVLAQATEMAERYCNRALRRKTVVETHDGDREALVLREPPILSVTTVVENGVTLSASDYTLNSSAGLLFRGSSISSRKWYAGRQSVVVTYVAGYTNPPLVAQRAVLDIARWMWQRTGQGPRPGFGQSADMADYGTDALPSWLMRPLDSIAMPGIA